MRIRTKLAMQFTLLVGLLLGVGLGTTYYLARLNALQHFRQRLQDRAYTAAALFLEADEQSNARTEQVRRRFLRGLPQEVVGIYDAAGHPAFLTVPNAFPSALIARVRRNHWVSVRRGAQQTVGVYYQDNQGDFSILVSATDYHLLRRLTYLRLVMLGVLTGSVLLSFGLGYWFARNALAPVSDLMHYAQKIGASDLHLRIPVGESRDELAELASTFNHMIARLEAAFEQQKNFVANASHELRTPLTAMIGEMQIVLSRPRPPEAYCAALESVSEEADKLKEIINRLLQLAQLDASEKVFSPGGTVRLDEVLYEACEEVMVARPQAQVTTVVQQLPENAEELIIAGDHQLFRQALINLIDNACKFSDNQEVTSTLNCCNGYVEISVTDHGIGIAPQDLEHVRQTFFRASNALPFQGYGVGLALANKIIGLHSAKLVIDSVLEQGTTMRVLVPRKI